MKSKMRIISLLGIMLLSPFLNAQKAGWSFGYQLTELQGDFGNGINIETPALYKDYFSLKLRANQMYLNYDQLGENKWSNFFTLNLSLSSKPTMVSPQIGLYWEGGVMAIFPHSDFANTTTQWAGLGLFGFDFYFDPSFSYFLEAGAVGSGARASKSDNRRIYANGFLINVGFKISLNQREKDKQ